MKMAPSSREGATAKKQSCVKRIPGLTTNHYIKDSQQSVSIAPKCISFSSSTSSRSGGEVVEILWEAAGSKNNTYQISARGNINNLNVHCSCPAYRKTRGAKTRDGGNKILVCKHLAAALDTVIDHNNVKQAVVNLLDDDDDDDDNDHGSRTNSDDDEGDQSTTWEPQRAAAMNSKKRAYGASSSAMTNNNDHPTATTKTPKAVSNPYKKKPSTATSSSNKKIKTTTEKKIYKRKIRASPEAPFKLFATPQDLQLRRQISDRNHWCWSQCKTLEEMIFGDSNSNNRDVQWMVISNYLVDFHSLSVKLPALQTIPRVVIFYGHSSSSSSNAPPSKYFPSATVDIFQLDPTQPANSTSNPLPHTHQYGTHHTKLFLIGYSNKIRVVVSTSNLQEIDDIKANAAYIEEFALKTGDDDDDDMTTATKTTSGFEETLIHYIQSYGYDKRRNWTGGNNSGGGGGVGRRRERLTETLTRYDYSTARGILIPSIPGYHNLKDDHGDDERQQQVGQLKLRQAIRNYTTKPSSGAGARPVICQFSSMSNLSEKYLRALQMSMDTYLARQTIMAKINPQSQLQLKLVYPSVQEIRDSFEGYRGGGTVPGGHKNVQKSFLKPLWYRWSGVGGGGGGSHDSRSSGNLQASTSSSSNDITKPNNVPHIKSYYQINDDNDGFDWICITSHNISQAAWGSIGENSWGGKRLYIRSWEMGVLISPQTLGVDKLVCWGNDSGDGSGFIGQGSHRLSNSGNNNNCDDTNATAAITTSTIPMPYHTHSLRRYERTDEPWAWDVENYPIPDRFGFHSRFG